MNSIDDSIRQPAISNFQVAIKCLIPNESILSALEILNGFLILTNRRLVQTTASGIQSYTIHRVLPHECIQSIETKKPDEIEILGKPLDSYGRYTIDERDRISIKAPKQEKGESKEQVQNQFMKGTKALSQVIRDIHQKSALYSVPVRSKEETLYLMDLPLSLTRNAILDLNTILQDKPYPNELHHEALKYLGTEAFLLEESLRDYNDTENGVLFAAGNKGIIWIRGIKKGRFMKNVLVETVDWENIKCITHQWQNLDNPMQVIYLLTKNGEDNQICVTWNPSINDDVMDYPWLIQSANGPWIIADLMYRYTGKTLRSSYPFEDHEEENYGYYT